MPKRIMHSEKTLEWLLLPVDSPRVASTCGRKHARLLKRCKPTLPTSIWCFTGVSRRYHIISRLRRKVRPRTVEREDHFSISHDTSRRDRWFQLEDTIFVWKRSNLQIYTSYPPFLKSFTRNPSLNNGSSLTVI